MNRCYSDILSISIQESLYIGTQYWDHAEELVQSSVQDILLQHDDVAVSNWNRQLDISKHFRYERRYGSLHNVYMC